MESKNFGIVMERFHENLYDHVFQVDEFPKEDVFKILRDIAAGLVYLREKGLIHR